MIFIDALEYIHELGYIHADIKAQNILRASVDKNQNKKRSSKRSHDEIDDNIEDDDKYYLIDYGLVEKYTLMGVHKPYEFDKRTANNGTCEFRSRDAHIGVISRRSDIESLGYNIILWFYGRHPWADMVKNADQVHDKKCWAMNNVDAFLNEAFCNKPQTSEPSDSKTANKSKVALKKHIPFTSPPKGLSKLFDEIKQLSHDSKPDYCKLKGIFNEIAKLNSSKASEISSYGLKKKINHQIISTQKKTNKNKRTSDVFSEDNIDTSSMKNKRILSSKVPLKSKLNLYAANGVYNGDLNENYNDKTEEEDEDSFEPNKKNTNKIKSKLKNIKNPQIANGTRSKRHSLSSAFKNSKSSSKLDDCQTTPRLLRNRIKLDLSDDDFSEVQVKSNGVKYTNDIKTKSRRIPRLSTPLMAMTPPEGGDSPLFGPFEPDDSIKENQIMPNRITRNLSFLQNKCEDEDTQDRDLRSCRIYINNKRCRPANKDTSSSSIIQNDSSSQLQPSTSQLSANSSATIEDDEIIQLKPSLTNGKINKRAIDNPKSKTKNTNVLKLKKQLLKNGKTNGYITSSKLTPATGKKRLAKADVEPSTSTPISNKSTKSTSSSVTCETAAMQRIRMLIEKKRQSIPSLTKK